MFSSIAKFRCWNRLLKSSIKLLYSCVKSWGSLLSLDTIGYFVSSLKKVSNETNSNSTNFVYYQTWKAWLHTICIKTGEIVDSA